MPTVFIFFYYTGACLHVCTSLLLPFRLFVCLFDIRSISKKKTAGPKLRGHCALFLYLVQIIISKLPYYLAPCAFVVYSHIFFSFFLAWKRRNWCLSQSFCFLFSLFLLGFYCVRACVRVFVLNMRQTIMIFPTEIDLSYVRETTERI